MTELGINVHIDIANFIAISCYSPVPLLFLLTIPIFALVGFFLITDLKNQHIRRKEGCQTHHKINFVSASIISELSST